jgi:hypothetical protein
MFFFQSLRGIRQGDPLSPLLFVVVMEALSKMLNESMLQGLLFGFSVGIRDNEALVVNYLLFADDTLIFCGAQAKHVRNLRCTFLCFEAVSGLRINLGKFELVSIGEVGDVESLAQILGCRIGSLPMTYLGLPLGASFRSRSIWNGVIEKVERRLASWKKLYLSKGGRVTLIHSTLSSIPTYYLSLFPIPLSVAKKLEWLQREFLWNGMGDETKFHLVNWHRVCSPIKVGGLGVRNIIKFNQALLGKWILRFSQERGALWRSVIEVKYGSVRGGWSSLPVTGSYGVSVWKFIRRGWDTVAKYLHFEVGEGSHICFWHDLWCGNRPLKLCYPDLYFIACFSDAWVVDNLSVVGGVAHWNVLFTRYAQDWEVEMVIAFYEQLYSIRIRHGEVDRVVWNLSKKRNFEGKTFYKALVCHEAVNFPWNGVWRVKTPKWLAFFVWTAALGKILTHDNLRRRGIVVVG